MPPLSRRGIARLCLARGVLGKIVDAVEEISNELTISCQVFPKTIKSFARAFLKARRVEGRSPSWVFKGKALNILCTYKKSPADWWGFFYGNFYT